MTKALPAALLLAVALLIRVAGPAVPPGREAGAQPYDPFAKG